MLGDTKERIELVFVNRPKLDMLRSTIVLDYFTVLLT